MRFSRLTAIAGWTPVLAVSLATPAHAGDVPLYQPIPAWVKDAPPIDTARRSEGSPLLVFDIQQKLEGDTAWNYTDTAVRADTPAALAQLGTITASWSPDKGDLIIHRAQILRGTEVIDLLASAKFDVLRREQQLESRAIDGTLTSTMAVPGLRVGDILRLTMTITRSDKAFAGHVQTGAPIVAEPVKAAFTRLRVLWPDDRRFRWSTGGRITVPSGADKVSGGLHELNVPVPIAKPGEMPDDAPSRFRSAPWFQITNFADWKEVSRVLAPLFATQGLIPEGSPLAGEIAAISGASSDPVERTARALELVQGKIAYLAITMNNGNYTPQPPARTWELRYGDCKAKTLMLLAMLRGMGIEAEPVLARAQGGDALPELLPMPGDFDHVLVHAVIGGRDYWLDGTGAGTRKDDLADTPPFFHVLPLRLQGADLLALPMHANARANVAVKLDLDMGAGVDIPPLYTVTIAFRGADAAQFNTSWTQTGVAERKDMLNAVIARYAGQGAVISQNFSYDDRTSMATITGNGIGSSGWTFESGHMRLPVDMMQSPFSPDRTRLAWHDIPVATPQPQTRTWVTRFQLPETGTGFRPEGDPAIRATLGGGLLERSGAMAQGTYTLAESVAYGGAEISAADTSAEKARAASAGKVTLALIAPADTRRSWQYGDAAGRTLLEPVEAAMAAMIAADPAKPEGFEMRSSLRSAVLDWRGAASDLDRAIALEPRAADYLARSGLRETLGDLPGALKDAVAAEALEPAEAAGISRHAGVLSRMGRHDEALALLADRLDTSGEDHISYVAVQAELLADAGRAAEGVALLDKAIAAKPGDPQLLNSRCWLKGTRNLALDTALRDCTRAIELAESPAAMLDSRAMVYFRMGRMDDALADYDAALQSVPAAAPSILMHGIILTRTGHGTEGQAQIVQALRMVPTLSARFKGYGIAP